MDTRDCVSTPREDMPSVAIVGAGVVGLCTALEAQRRGYEVTLIDRSDPGCGASFGNAGYLATELIDPLATGKTMRAALAMWLKPKGPLALPLGYLPRLLPWLVRFIAAACPSQVRRSREALVALNQAAVPAWQRCLKDIDASEQLVRSGYLLVWENAGRLENARQHAEYLNHWNIHAELVRGTRLAELEPALAGTVSHALYFPDAYRVRDPYQLCQILFDRFCQRGGHFIRRPVGKLLPDDSGVTLQTPAGQLRFERAVVCTGAWSKQLVRSTGVKVPLEAERGYHLTFEDAAVELTHTIGSAERRFVISPLDSGLRAVGFSELGGLRLKPIARRFRVLRQHSSALLPALGDRRLTVREWMGHRPTLPDSLPVIGRHPRYQNLFFAFGNQHLGLTQAAISAELVVSMLSGSKAPIDAAPYAVDRFVY